tara:strand:+ start:87 stop:431 length:345 start_codon:yes stop_codon:yes gene_type:complete
MTFFQAINSCFKNYSIFRGRSTRSEYWNWRLFELLLVLIAIRLDFTIFKESEVQHFSLFIFFLTFLPGLSVSVRRLHDIGKSGWWLMISLTGIGNFLLLYWFLLPSEDRHNIYN